MESGERVETSPELNMYKQFALLYSDDKVLQPRQERRAIVTFRIFAISPLALRVIFDQTHITFLSSLILN